MDCDAQAPAPNSADERSGGGCDHDPSPIVFLIDVDNTLLDNDRIQSDLKRHLEREWSRPAATILGDPRTALTDLGYRDYLGALQRYRSSTRKIFTCCPCRHSCGLPVANRLYPGSLDVLERFRSWGQTVILSDGDVVFSAAQGRTLGHLRSCRRHVLTTFTKKKALDDVERRYPLSTTSWWTNKLRILTTVQEGLEVARDHGLSPARPVCHDRNILAACPPADLTVERVSACLIMTCPFCLAATIDPNFSGGKQDESNQLLHNLGRVSGSTTLHVIC